MPSQEIREKAISLVKQGLSITKTAQQLNVSAATVSRWCQQAGVQSKYKTQPKSISDEQILEVVKRKKVATVKEIADTLGTTYGIINRLRKLVRKGKLKSTRIPKIHNTAIKRYIGEYMNKTLFYIDEKTFTEWYFSKLPKQLPKHLKKVFSHILHDIGIEFEKRQKTKVAIMIPKKMKQQLVERAKQENISVEELLRRAI